MTIQKTFSWIVVIIVAVGLVVLAYLNSGQELQAPTPPADIPLPSTTLSPGPALLPTLYKNEYISVTVPTGWSITQSGKSNGVNLTKGKYILYINPRAQQASGVTGGRFAEIAQGSPSADAVVTVQPSEPCGTKVEIPTDNVAYRQDLYVSSADKKDGCTVPTNGKTVWYFSYATNPDRGYFNYYKGNDQFAWVVTMSYQATNPNDLPEKDSPELTQMLREMTQIFQTLQLKTPTN